MPKLSVTPLDPSGSPLVGATVTVYVEDTSGEREEFDETDLAELYTDVFLTSAAANPNTIPGNGTLELYAKSFQFFAIKIERAGYGVRWVRNHEMIGTTPVGGP